MGMRKINILSGAALSILLLSACNNDIDSIEQALEETEETQESAVSDLQQLVELESQLQDAFNTDISEDEDLSSFADGSATVFNNIDERKQKLENLESLSNEFSEQREKFAEIDVQSVSGETVNSVADRLGSLSGSVDEFTSAYDVDLDQQADYFESLGQDDATYETFENGIESVNESRETTQSLLVDVDTELADLQSLKDELSSQLDAAANE
ncbi:YkyA family protein [Salinicoccus sesuvii]|uniref:YkyA family protein n=1 Tax=Salinicoccus sesuvii TaxID=868281 RepID=A0ABV7N380_9STAP